MTLAPMQCAGALAFAGAWLLPQSSLVPAGLHGCDGMFGGAPASFEREVVVAGARSFRQEISMHSGQGLLLLVGEKGVDVLLSASRGDAVLRADSPLHGFGVQHLLLPGEPGDWQVQVSAKDPDAPPGVVSVRAVHLPVAGKRACVRIQRALALADAAYAHGWAISNEVMPAASEGAAEVAYGASVDGYREVLGEPVPQPLRGAMLLSLAAGHYHGLSNWHAAQAWAARAARLYHHAQDDYASAQSRSLRGIALIEVDPEAFPDSLTKAEALLRAAARTHAARGERREQALALNNLGITLYLSGRYEEARRAYETAASLFEALGEQTRAWQVADNMGLIDYDLGRLETAARTYEALVAQPGLRARPRLYLNVLTNGALVQLERGEAGKALRAYQEALGLARDIQDDFVVALSLQGIGGAYEALGDPDMALTHYHAALRLRTREASARYRLETLWSLGDVERRLGRAGRALALDREALALADTDLDRARMHLRIASDHEALGQPGQALEQLALLFDRRIRGDGFIHAQALLLRGRMHTAAARWQEAGSDLRVALQAFERLDSASGQFHARMAIAALERDRGEPAAAFEEVDAAIALAERLRLQSANPGLRASLLETLRPAYDLKIELLGAASATARTGALREQLAWKALEVAESARARAMQDYAALASGGTGANSLLASRRTLYVELAQAQARLDRASLDFPADDPVLQTIRENVAALRGQIDQLESRMAPEQDPGTSAGRPPVLHATALPPGIAMVQYWLGARRAFAWVASAGSLQMLDLGSSTRIAEAAATTQAVLRDSRNADASVRLQALRHLSGLVWQPLASLVPARATVVFMPDMTLHYIPFAALVDGPSGQFLIQGRDVATAASLRQLLETIPMPQPHGQRMLIVADPRYGSGVAPLPATAREADAIARIAAGLHVDRLQGPQATRARFLGAPLGDYQFIHVATHALANARIPQLSALQLAASGAGDGDDQVYAADLLSVKLNAQLVVLSACDTALGRVVSGEGVIGLRYVLLARGAQAVVSSLWQVGDRHAEEFMTEFYSSLLGGGFSSAAAMSAAMRSLMARHGDDPAAWAAFELSVRSLPAAWPGPPMGEE